MDLHTWITQQVDYAEETARLVEDRSAPWDGQWMADGNSAVRTVNGHVLFYRHGPDPLKSGLADHVAANDPATVLRRCEADRRILARHRLDPNFPYETACYGCGTYGDLDLSNTDNLNDCPELLDLAHAHGITPDVLAGLDQPQSPEPKPRGPADPLLAGIFARTFGLPTKPITTSDVPEALRGPRWKP
ncbi:DUF6221 family protein [Streptomyces rubiginosohelvolus]|uniref:DUF6221 family protein n=1 Tax=Streptomyces rubiginosohelvolus TaxID=67362 RepID=UPI00367E004A